MLRGQRKMQSTQAEDANHLIHDTYNMQSKNSLVNRILMVDGSWLMAQGSPARPWGRHGGIGGGVAAAPGPQLG